MSGKDSAGDFVYTDVGFGHYRRRRAERLLRTGTVLLLAYAVVWSGVALVRGDWLTLALQSISCCGAAWVWYCLARGQLGLASHSYFWVVIPVVACLVGLEGIAGPFRSMNHYHLLPLTVGAYLLFFEHGERARRLYAGGCLAIFVSVESRCGAMALGCACLLPPLSSGGAQVARP